MATAIEALAKYYNSLDTDAKAQFQKETGFSSIPVGIMSAKFAENYCKTHNIKFDNIWSNSSGSIADSVEEWYLGKEQKKAESEAKYYAALNYDKTMTKNKNTAQSNLIYAQRVNGEDSSQYATALKKFNQSKTLLSGADINLDIARDHFNSDNMSAYKAYLTTRGLKA